MGCCCTKLESRIEDRFGSSPSAILRQETFHANLRKHRNYEGSVMVKGNGSLVLTNAELWFSRLAPRQDWDIPIAKLTKVYVDRLGNVSTRS